MNIQDINNNILSKRQKERVALLDSLTQKKLKKFYSMDASEFQLNVIKRKRLYPQIGDIFIVNPCEKIQLQGLVLNNHVNNINGDDLLVVLIFVESFDVREFASDKISYDSLLIPPQIVGKEYWTRGYFGFLEHLNNKHLLDDYGFYSIGKQKFFNEYGEIINDHIPNILGLFGVCTIFGIGQKITEELIIRGYDIRL